jgi:hypothetical protein
MRSILILIAMSLSACSSNLQTPVDSSSPYYRLPVGSKVVLKQDLAVPPGRTRLFLQQGQTMMLGDFDRYLANCNFEISSLSEASQTIQSQQFTVSKVEDLMVEVVQQDSQQLFLKVGMDDSATPMVTRGYHFWLSSAHQSDVIRLSCRGAFDDMWAALPPTLEEIRHAVGDLIELQLAL